MKAVLEESAIPRKLVRRFPPHHEPEDLTESRRAVVTLHEEGWSDKSIARYLRVDRSTFHRVRRRYEEEGEEGLEDRLGGRPRGVQKVDLRAMNEVRKMQENPELGAFRVHAALELMGIRLSPRTVGRILAANREAEGLEKPLRGRKENREMPFEASRRHEYWTADVRYVQHAIPETGQAYSPLLPLSAVAYPLVRRYPRRQARPRRGRAPRPSLRSARHLHFPHRHRSEGTA